MQKKLLHQLLLLILIIVEMMSSTTQAIRSDGEARTQCIAACLKEFKARVSPQLSAKLSQHPYLINSECGGGGGGSGAEVAMDKAAVSACSSCSRACNWFDTKSFPRNSTGCEQFCKPAGGGGPPDSASCAASCSRLSTLLVTNPGDCPTLASSSAADGIGCRAAGSPCLSPGDDRDCAGGLKPMRCCRSDCGISACQTANISLDALPPTPQGPYLKRAIGAGGILLNHRRQQTAMEIDWSSYSLDPEQAGPDPVFFLLQVRSRLSRQFDAFAMTTSQWRDLAVTSQTRLLVEDLAAGAWYQFRLAAVSSAGFRAYSEASDPVKTGDALPPRPPRGLREADSRIHSGGSAIDIRILWRQPARGDPDELPVAKYQISWVEMIGIERESSKVFDASVPEPQTSFTLTNLKLGTTYRISVAAVASYGHQNELRSRNSTFYLTTMRLVNPTNAPTQAPPLPPPPPQQPPSPTQDQNDSGPQRRLQTELGRADAPAHTIDCSCHNRPKSPLVFNLPYYEAGKLKLLLLWPSADEGLTPRRQPVTAHIIKWTQRVCIESEPAGDLATRQAVVHNGMAFTISDLRFNCHYALQVRGLTNSGDVAFAWNTCFCTRSCKETQIRGDHFPICPRDEAASAPQPPTLLDWSVLPRPILAPSQQQQQQQRQRFYSIRIRWAAPGNTALHAISGFRITWGPVVDDVGVAGGSGGGLEPRLDADRSDASVVDVRERQFNIYHLRAGTVYVVMIQTMSVFGDSQPARLTFATPDGASSSQSSSSSSNSEVQKYINKDRYRNGAGVSVRVSLTLLILLHLLLALATRRAAQSLQC